VGVTGNRETLVNMKKLILFLSLLGYSAAAQQLKGGVALRIVTPSPLLPVSGGVGVPKAADEKKGELYVRAMVLVKGEEKVALVSIDNLGWPSVLGNRTRALLPQFKPENILISATHTHSAPDAYAFPDQNGKHYADMDYLNFCVEAMASCISDAEAKVEEVHLKVAYGKVRSGIAYNYYAPDLYDPGCGVLQLLSKNTGKALGTLVNFAIHPEVLGSKRGILSPDLCGPLYTTIEEGGGGIGLFFNGALGGMVTADTRRAGGEENTWEECIRIGSTLGKDALALISKEKIIEEPELAVKHQVIHFPVESAIMRYILEHSPLVYSTGDSVSTVQNWVKIGPARMLTIPGEALPNIGYYLKRNMQTDFPFLLGLTNDAFGYMMTAVDYNSFERYQYISRTSLGERTGDILIENSLQLIKNAKK
jgi:hypothetical protein